MRRKDAVLIAFFAGTLSITLLITIFAICIPPASEDEAYLDWEELFATFPVFRLFLMLILTILFVGIDVKILRSYKINYLFIFELDPHYKITHI